MGISRCGGVGQPTLDQTDQAILEALAGGEGRFTSEIARVIELTPGATGTQDPKRRHLRSK